MPLRDHFRPPVESRHSWDELHGGWPMVIVQKIFPQLPEGFVAAPGVHLAKVSALLQRSVSVSLVDVVTIRQFNLYADLLQLFGGNDPAFGTEPPCLYAVTIRSRKRVRRRSLLESWFYPMQLGQLLPTLPVWLDVDLNISLELESSYEETCRVLRIS